MPAASITMTSTSRDSANNNNSHSHSHSGLGSVKHTQAQNKLLTLAHPPPTPQQEERTFQPPAIYVPDTVKKQLEQDEKLRSQGGSVDNSPEPATISTRRKSDFTDTPASASVAGSSASASTSASSQRHTNSCCIIA